MTQQYPSLYRRFHLSKRKTTISRSGRSCSNVKRPIVFVMDGMTRLGNGVEKWIRENWIKDFSLASKVEFRRHDREGYSLSLENVRGRKVYILQSFASDDMTAVFSPKCANRFRVKIKTAIPGISLPLDKVGTATWRDEPGNSDIVVRFDNDRCMTFNEHDRTKYLHVLGETVDEKVWGTILFIHSLINASCADVTILGMLPYMRQDEKDQPRAPIDTAAFVTQMKAAGVNRLITIDVHNKGAMQNACAVAKLHFDHLEARCLLAAEAIRGIPEGRRVVAAAPDVGASKRATPMFQETLSRLLKRRVGFAIVRKIRIGDTATKVTTLIEDPDFPIGPRPGHGPEDAAYILCQDDILATGGTIKDCKKITEERGGIFHAACYTNGLFTGNAQSNLAGIPLIGTDVCSLWRVENTPIYEQIRTIDTSPLFARAIMETHLNGSINQLLSALEPR